MNRKLGCGVIAGPLFVGVFTVLGSRRAGYDWRRHAVSSLAVGREGARQRSNFMIVGGLYCVAARGLARSPSRVVGPAVVPALVFAAGVGLIGSGLFVTDPVAGFPPERAPAGGFDAVAQVAPTRSGQLHNLCAIPIFVGLPVAALVAAGSAVRRREYRWATYCAGSAIGMATACALRRGFWWRADARFPRRSLPAHLDRGRIRMAQRRLIPRVAPGVAKLSHSPVQRLSRMPGRSLPLPGLSSRGDRIGDARMVRRRQRRTNAVATNAIVAPRSPACSASSLLRFVRSGNRRLGSVLPLAGESSSLGAGIRARGSPPPIAQSMCLLAATSANAALC